MGSHVRDDVKSAKAYIAGFGTAGVLVAAAMLLLGVVGTIVAFRGWDRLNVPGDVGDLVIREPGAIEIGGAASSAGAFDPVSAHSSAKRARRASGRPQSRAERGAPRPRRAPVPRQAPVSPPRRPGEMPPLPPHAPPPPSGVPTPPTGLAGLTDALAGTTERLTGGLGQTAAGVDPRLGETVTGTGRSVAGLLRGLNSGR
jgi:hypothetical protein